MSILSKKIAAILLAGGKGKRMGSDIPKQFLPLKGKEIALYSFDLLVSIEEIGEIVVVCDPTYHYLFKHPKLKFASPGDRRQDSVYNGLKKCSLETEYVIVHDSARPFITKEHVLTLIQEAEKHKAAISAVPVKSTIKQATDCDFVKKTLERAKLWEIHTPQVIQFSLLKKGLESAIEQNITVTDDASAIELIGCFAKLVLGSYQNIKITTPEDYQIAQIQM